MVVPTHAQLHRKPRLCLQQSVSNGNELQISGPLDTSKIKTISTSGRLETGAQNSGELLGPPTDADLVHHLAAT